MKLRSTLFFAAASLTASALAPVVATTSAFFAASSISAEAAGEIISLNFGSNAVDSGKTGTAGFATYKDTDGAETKVSADGWTNTTGNTGTQTNIKNYDGKTISGASVNWNGPNTHAPSGAGATVESAILSSYLDLGANNQWNVSIDTPFLVCDVYVYLSGDGGKFSPININGTAYVGGTDTVGSEAWGDRKNRTEITLTGEGANALKVTGQAGIIALSNVAMNNTGVRGTLAGIQVQNAYQGTTFTGELTGGTVAWGSAFGASEWKDSDSTLSAEGVLSTAGGAYAEFKLTADTTLTVADAITTDAIYVSGAGLTLGGGGTITLSGPAIFRAEKDSALAFSLGALAFAENVTGVTFTGTGTMRILDAISGTESYAKLKNIATWGGTVAFAGTVAAGDAFGVSAGTRIFENGLSAGSASIAGSSVVTVNGQTSISGTTTVETAGTNVTFNGKTTLGAVTLTSGNLIFKDEATVNSITATGGKIDFGTNGVTVDAYTQSNQWSNTTLDGTATITNDLTVSATGAKVTLGDGAQITVGKTYASATGASGHFELGAGAILSAQAMTSYWGTEGTLKANAILNVVGDIFLSPGGTARTIKGDGTGIINSGSLTLGNYAKYTFEGVRFNIGAGGIVLRDNNADPLTFKNATVGSLADAWLSASDLIITETVTIDTTVQNRDDLGRTTATGSSATISLKGLDLTAATSLVVEGLGKVIVDGKISMAANEDSSIINLKSGSLELGENVSFALTGTGTNLDNKTLKIVNLGTGATLTGATFDKDDFTWNGVVLSGRTVVNTDNFSTNGTISFSGKAWDLVWNGGEAGTWNSAGDNKIWTSGGDAAEFVFLDNVEFSTAGAVAVTLGEALVAGKVSITAGEVTFLGSGSVSADLMTISGGNLTLGGSAKTTVTTKGGTVVSGTGVLTLDKEGNGSTSALRGKLTIENGGKVNLTGGDATGYNGGNTAINTLVINEGGELIIKTDSSQDGGNQTFNMSGGITLHGGKITGTVLGDDGIQKSKFDLHNSSTGLNSLASATTSEVSASVGLRRSGTINVQDGEAEIDLLISGSLITADNNTKFNKTGAGTLKLTGNNSSWTNGGTVSGGTLIAASETALGTGALTVANVGALIIESALSATTGAITVNGSLTFDNGTDTSVFDSTFAAKLSGNGKIIKKGDGSLTLSAAESTHNGNIDVEAGTLVLTGVRKTTNGSSSLVTIAKGATLDISGTDGKLFAAADGTGNGRVNIKGTLNVFNYNWGGSLGALNHNMGNVTLDGGEIIFNNTHETARNTKVTALGGKITADSTKTITSKGGFDIDAGGTLQLGGAGSFIFEHAAGASDAKIGGGGSLEKIGTGKVTLKEESTYTGGTKVTEGTLEIAKATALGTGKVTLAGGTLAGIVTDSKGVEWGAGKEIVVAGAGSTLSGITLAGGKISFADIDSSLTLGADMTFTSGTLDFSQIIFTTDNSEMTVFEGIVNQTILDALNASTVTSGGEFVLRGEEGSPQTIVFVQGEALRLLEWNTSSEDKTWSSASFSGKEFKTGTSVLFSTHDGSETVTISAAVNAPQVLVNAGATGSYEFINSGNLTATEILIKSGELVLNEIGTTIKNIKIEDGGRLVLKSDNDGFDSITLAASAELVIKSNAAFRNANNAATGGAILGSGTIVLDLASSLDKLTINPDGTKGLAGALSNVPASLFTGKLLVRNGTFHVNGNYGGKVPKMTFAVEDGGSILVDYTGFNNAALGANLQLAGSGIKLPAGDTSTVLTEEQQAALSFINIGANNSFSVDVDLMADTTIFVKSDLSPTISGHFFTNGHTLTKTGAGTLVLGNDLTSLTNVNVVGGELRFNNNAAKEMSTVTLDSGTTFAQYSASTLNPDRKTTLDGLVLNGDATVKQTNHSGWWKIGSLSLGTGTTSAKLSLNANQSADQIALFEFEFGERVSSVGDFKGTIELSQTNHESAWRGAAIILSNGEIAKNAVISFTEPSSSNVNIGLGIHAESVTIAGLESMTSTAPVVFSGTLTAGNKANAAGFSIQETGLRTLIIDTDAAQPHLFLGSILNNLNLVKRGQGMQVLAGDSAKFNGTVSVEEGTLTVSDSATALGLATEISVAENAAFAIDSSSTLSFDKRVVGAGTLKTSGFGSVTFSGALDIKNVQVTEGGTLVFATENESLDGTLTVDGGGGTDDMFNASTFATDFDFTVNGLSGAGSVSTSTNAVSTRTLTLAGADSSAFTGTIRDINITNTGTGHSLAGAKWAGKEPNSDYTGTVKISSGTLTMGGANAGFKGTIEMAGGTIGGTLELNAGTLTASVKGATTIENLTLAGGTVEFTRLDSKGEGATEKQWYSTGVLNFAGGEGSETILSFKDTLTSETDAGVTKYTLFEFDSVSVNGTGVTLTDKLAGEELFRALGGHIQLSGAYESFAGLIIAYVAGTDGGKGKIEIWSSERAKNLFWVGDDLSNWTQADVWADGSTEGERTYFTSGSEVTLSDLKDGVERTIYISGSVQPQVMNVNGGEYILELSKDADTSKTNGIIGSGTKLLVSGGTLTVNLDNSFGGGTTILSGGTVNVGADRALGSGDVQVGGALNFIKNDDSTFANVLKNYIDAKGNVTAGTITYTGGATLTLTGDRSEFTGTLAVVNAGTVVLANGTGTESFSGISIAEAATLSAMSGAAQTGTSAFGWGDYSTSTLTLGQVSGTGTLVVNSQAANTDKNFFILNLAGSTFTGTLELNALDLTLGAEANFGSEVVSSTLGSVSVVRLTNAASLNFFNEAQTFDKAIDVADTNGALRVYGNNSGVVISGEVSGAGTLTVKDGGVISFTNEVALGGLTVEDATASFTGALLSTTGDVSLGGTSATLSSTTTTVGGNLVSTAGTFVANGTTFNVTGDATLGGTSVTLSSTTTTINNLTASAATVNLSGTINIVGDLTRNLSVGGSKTSLSNGATVSVRGTSSFLDNENLSLGAGASFSTGTLTTGTLGFGATLAANAKLSAQNINLGTNATIAGAGATSRLEIGNDAGRGTLTGTEMTVSDLTLAGRETGVERWANWTSSTNLKLNGGKTWVEVQGLDQKITLNGLISEAGTTSSILEKTGAGTLVLGQANTNIGGTIVSAGTLEYVISQDNYAFAQGATATGTAAGLTLASGAILKFTSTATTDKTINLGLAEFGFVGDKNVNGAANLIIGSDTILNASSDTSFKGHVVLATESRGGALNFTGDTTFEDSLTLKSNTNLGLNLGVSAGATLTLSDLTFASTGTAGAASTIGGGGTLALNGTVSVLNRFGNNISTETLELAGDTTIDLAQNGTLTISSAVISATGNWLTKTGAGTLAFNTDALLTFDGSFNIASGSVNLNGSTLNIGGTNEFILGANATLNGNLDLVGTALDNRVSATLGSGSRITGNVNIENTALTFAGSASGIQRLDWGDGNTIALDQAFRASLSGSITLLTFQNGFDANGNAFTANTDFGDIFVDAGGFLGRDVEVGYSETNGLGSINIVVTGALQWNDTVTTWISDNAESAKWDLVTKGGLVEKGTHFTSGDYVEFGKAGSIRIEGTLGNGIIVTTGMVFNLGNNNIEDPNSKFTITARRDLENKPATSVITGAFNGNEGLTVLSGNIVIEEMVQNGLRSTNVFGGSLTVSHGHSLSSNVVLGSENGGSALLIFQNVKNAPTDQAFKTITVNNTKTIQIGNNGVVIQVVEKDGTVVIANALEKTEQNIVSGLSKTGEGTLNINRGSQIDSLNVAAGTLNLVGGGTALGVKDVQVRTDAILNVATQNGTANGANAAFGNLTLGGTMNIGDNSAGHFRANQIFGEGGTISGTLYIGDGTSFEMGGVAGGTQVVSGTAIGGSLTITGAIDSYGTGALHKFQAGMLMLTTAEGNAGKFQLGTDFVHHEGVVNFTQGVNATGTYSITGPQTIIQIASNSDGQNSFGGLFTVGENAAVTFELGAGTHNTDRGVLFNNGFTADEASLVIFSATGTDRNRVHNVTIANNGAAVSMGNLLIGDQGVINLNISEGLTAGQIQLNAGSTLKLGSDSTADALAIGGALNANATLDLSGNKTMTLTNVAGNAVLFGEGTLTVKGGTLSVNGENYSELQRPTIVLDNATFNFDVLADGVVAGGGRVYSGLAGIQTATGKTGIVSKTGEGTLVLFDDSGDLGFNGTISLEQGATELYSRVSKANLTIETDASLRFYGIATTGTGVDQLATSISGAGTLEVGGRLTVDSAAFDFDGTLSAGASTGNAGGQIVASGALNDWLSNGVAGTNREVILQNSGQIFASGENVTISEVSLKASGTNAGMLSGANGIQNAGFVVEKVFADAGTTLNLANGGTLGDLSFANANGANALAVLGGGTWTFNGASTNLSSVSIGALGTLDIANFNALSATTGVTVGNTATLRFSAGGTYSNTITLAGGFAEISAVGADAVSLTGTIIASAAAGTVARFNAGNNEVAGTLNLSGSVLGLANINQALLETETVDSKISVDVSVAANLDKVTMGGAGSFEKTGSNTLTVKTDVGSIGSFAVSAGTVSFTSAAELDYEGEGNSGALSVATGATLNVSGTNLGGFTLSGAGTTKLTSGVALAGIDGATNVALTTGSTAVTVSGNVSGSTLDFAASGASLVLTGAGVNVSDTIFNGATVAFTNSGTGSQTYAGTNSFDAGTKKLVLKAANVGNSGGVVNTAFSGSLEKTGDGTWTVTKYTYGSGTDETLKVNAGMLVWENAAFGTNAGEITLGAGSTLRIKGLAAGAGQTLAGTIGGSGKLEIAGAQGVILGTTAAANSSWGLKISGGSSVTIKDALPGSLEVMDSQTVAKIDLSADPVDAVAMTMEKQLYIGAGATLEKSGEGTLAIKNVDPAKQNTILGKVSVTNGTFAQNAAINWMTSGSELSIGTGGVFEVSITETEDVGYNGAKLSGSGLLTIADTADAGYLLLGDLSTFAGTVDIKDKARLVLNSGAMFGSSIASIAINEGGTLAVLHSSGGTFENLSGKGKVEINAANGRHFYKAIYTSATTSNGFEGNFDVKSGALSVMTSSLASDNVKWNATVGGAEAAVYSENNGLAGLLSGAFLRVENDETTKSIDVSNVISSSKITLNDNAGMIFAGNKGFHASQDFGKDTSLFVVEKDSSLTLTQGADISGSVFVASGASLEVNGSNGTRSNLFATSADSYSISGDLTLNGELIVNVTDAMVQGTLLGVGGETFIDSGNSGKAAITLDISKMTGDLASQDIVILNGYMGTGNLDEILSVEAGGKNVEISRDGAGNIVVVSAVNDYHAPSGLSGLFDLVKQTSSSGLWTYLKGDRADHDTMDKKLVALSPVSFGSLVEMQSGFAALENDLLRERLEQRRYERAYASDRGVKFKPFINILGASRDGSGNGTDSSNYDITHTGALGGFDFSVSDNTIFGISLGLDWAKADLKNGGGKHESDSSRFGVYGMSMFGNTYLGYGVSGGGSSMKTKRNSGFNGETLKGETDGNDFNASLLFGAGWTLDKNIGIDIAPYVGLDLGYARAKAFTEEGGAETALDVEKMERWSLRGKIGATLNWRATERLRVGIDASFAHEFLDSDMDIDAKFASGNLAGKAFSSTAYLMDENTFQIGPRLDYRIDDTWSVSAAYSFETDMNDTMTHSANLGFRARF